MVDSKTVHKSLQTVYLSTRSNLVRLVSKLVPPKEVEDIVQETYVRICQLEKNQGIEKPRAFLLTTAKNLAYDHLKRAETRLADGVENEYEYDDFLDTTDYVFKSVQGSNEFEHFCEAIRQLPKQCRRVFVLKKVYGYSQKEIAIEMNLSQSTVEKHIATGFKKCVEHMNVLDDVEIPKRGYRKKQSNMGQ